MLIYVDAPKVIRVYRPGEATDGPKRITLGTITKNTCVSGSNGGHRGRKSRNGNGRRQLQSCRDGQGPRPGPIVPEIARQIAAYYAAEATDIEKHLISVAVLEMSRAIKKADRPQAASNAEAA